MSSELNDIRKNIFLGIGFVRNAITRALVVIVVLASGGYMISGQVIDELAKPVKQITSVHDHAIISLPAPLAREVGLKENDTVRLKFSEDQSTEATVRISFSSGVVFTAPAEAFITRIKIAAAIGILLGFPFLIWQLIGLFSHRIPRKALWIIYASIPLISALFYLGAFVSIKIVVPLGLRFLLSFQTGALRPMLSINEYASFVIISSLLIGVIFEMPLLIAVLARFRILTAQGMMEKRGFAYIAFFALAAILTPPDIISQVLLGVPLIFLYEIGILIAWIMPKHRHSPQVSAE